ncbi:MAG: 4Fe-4S dicluster domain-containing protein [Phycisphaerales bacterium]|nr:MAG: 4Fe-4S dicluster domain-containing protein [Phycisphaerales bacterium]
MANGKSMLFDSTLCLGCRSCQVACKQWNELPAEPDVPINRGTYENPPRLTSNTWIRVTYRETERPDGTLAWHFMRNSCRHCLDAPCRQATKNADSIVVDEQTGAVLHEAGTKNESYAEVRCGCPFDGPRQGSDGQLAKCRMCVDRVHNGELPACVKACPAGALTFGDRDEILQVAEERLAEVKAESPNATILDKNQVRVLILLAEPASMYALGLRD